MQTEKWDNISDILFLIALFTGLMLVYLVKIGYIDERSGKSFFALIASAGCGLGFLYSRFTKTVLSAITIKKDKNPFIYWFFTLFYLFASFVFLSLALINWFFE
jgi:hypothetical protein